MPKGLMLATCLWTLLAPALCGGGLIAHACDCGPGICSHEDDCDHDPCEADFLRPTGAPDGPGSAQPGVAICPPLPSLPTAPAEAGRGSCRATQRAPALATHESDLPLLN